MIYNPRERPLGGFILAIVRIWDEVHHVYRQVSDKHNVTLGHLMSALLMTVPVECPGCVAYALQEAFEMKPERAREIAMDLMDMFLELIQLAQEADTGGEERTICKER